MRARFVLPLVVILFASVALVARGHADGPAIQDQAAPAPSSGSPDQGAQSTAAAAPDQGGPVSPATVQVTTDRQSYVPGDTVTVSITNQGTATVMPRGGRVCDSFWPIRLDQQTADGWTAVSIPQDPVCAGASVAPFGPGQSITKTFTVSLSPGTYRVVFPYDVVGGQYGTLPPADSNPFTVQN